MGHFLAHHPDTQPVTSGARGSAKAEIGVRIYHPVNVELTVAHAYKRRPRGTLPVADHATAELPSRPRRLHCTACQRVYVADVPEPRRPAFSDLT